MKQRFNHRSSQGRRQGAALSAGIAFALYALLGCQAISGVNDLELVSDEKFEEVAEAEDNAAKPNGNPEDEPEDPSESDLDDQARECLDRLCSAEADACASSGCREFLACAFTCDGDEDCIADCGNSVPQAALDEVNAYLRCALECDEEIQLYNACVAGTEVFCECGDVAATPCATGDRDTLLTCCDQGPETCESHASLVCFSTQGSGNVNSCSDAFEVCVPE